MVFHALVPAAGSGERFGAEVPKQFVEVAGRALLEWTLDRLLRAGAASVTVAVPVADIERARQLSSDDRVLVIAGGGNRQDSVELCLAGCPADPEEWVLVHDGARPALHRDDLRACLEAAAAGDGAVLGRPVSDTLKLVASGRIESTVDRSFLFRAETPQVFQRELLERALAEARADGFVGTDEASLVERIAGTDLTAVAAAHPNPKLTTPADLRIVEALLER